MGVDILHVLATSQRRGAETFACQLSELLANRGRRSTVVALASGPAKAQLPVATLGLHRYGPRTLRELRRRARRTGILVGHGSSTLAAGTIATLGLHVPFVYVNIGDPRQWASTRSRRLRVGALLRRAATVVAISPAARDLLIKMYGLQAARVWVIPNGRSSTIYRPADGAVRLAARQSLGLPQDRPVLASVGALTPEKRVDIAVRAMADLPDAILVVAGDGPERFQLEQLAGEVAPGRVYLVGMQPTSLDVLAAADVVVMSSDSEGVPGVLIEAALCGLPAVTTDVGFVREVVVPGRTGELAPAGDPPALAAAALRAYARAADYGMNARAYAQRHFDLHVIADQWDALIDSLLATHGGTSAK